MAKLYHKYQIYCLLACALTVMLPISAAAQSYHLRLIFSCVQTGDCVYACPNATGKNCVQQTGMWMRQGNPAPVGKSQCDLIVYPTRADCDKAKALWTSPASNPTKTINSAACYIYSSTRKNNDFCIQ